MTTSNKGPESGGGRPDRVAVVGTGLMGTSIASASIRTGLEVRGWDPDPNVARRAGTIGGFTVTPAFDDAVRGADLVVVATPISAIAPTVIAALRTAPRAIVTDVGSIKGLVAERVRSQGGADAARYVPGHPMGGAERSGPEHASPSLVDGIAWVVAPHDQTSEEASRVLETFAKALGARPIRLSPQAHDRLVAIVSHLPQVASSSLMSLAATEEADEPEILLLAAGGFRDLTRLAASDPSLWSEILIANRDEIVRAIELFQARLGLLRSHIAAGQPGEIERAFEVAKRARLGLATKPQVRAGVAVIQVQIPDRPGALAAITSTLGEGSVNIEDLQIVHSFEGGSGTVHLTVAEGACDHASEVLRGGGYDPVRLA